MGDTRTAAVERLFGKVTTKAVVYNGASGEAFDVKCLNAEEYLCGPEATAPSPFGSSGRSRTRKPALEASRAEARVAGAMRAQAMKDPVPGAFKAANRKLDEDGARTSAELAAGHRTHGSPPIR